MPGETRRLPLFPLNTVLFPHATLPLQIFEERYKTMLQDCQQFDMSFGAVLIKSGSEVGEHAEPHRVGTVAKIVQVSDGGKGKFFISAIGQQRFRILTITLDRPYMTGQVELLDDDLDSEQELLPAEVSSLRKAVMRYTQTVVGLGGNWVGNLKLPEDPVKLSYFIPKLLQIEPRNKQALLEMPTVFARLETERSIVETQHARLKSRLHKELLGKFSRS
ncbi:MAG: LON peptidase substrate-binding domain-containing protein [Chloroflexi bacterium]|nr:LON peptidase substrate-binding domain-containing protein [Chloroflexota bacterium]